MIYRLASLVLLCAAASAQNCSASEGCFEDADCTSFGSGITCIIDTTTTIGCCNVTSTTTTTTSTTARTTTRASSSTNSSCVDLLNPMTGVSDCPARSNLCTDSVYLEVMRQQCPRTCGFCGSSGNSTNSSSSTSCVDLTNPSTGVSDCPNRKAYCNNTIYNALMRIQCPATCGFCTSG